MPEPKSQAPSTPTSLAKKALIDAGFEVFRTRGDEIVLAERPRENLIMDSGVRLFAGEPLEVRVVLRAQKTDFPNEDEAALFGRVRARAAGTLDGGFAEAGAAVTRVHDPGDAERTLDVFYEVTFAKSASSMSDALAMLKVAMGIEKRV